MTHKKIYIFTISSILLLIITTIIGTTYAYYSIVVSGNNNVESDSKKFEIVYIGGDHITGDMSISANKEGGKNTIIEMGLAPGSTAANGNLYIQIESITDNLSIAAFNWEVYTVNGTTETYVNSGNFLNKKTGDNIPIVTDYPLSETITKFKVYFWIDVDNASSDIMGGSFDCYVGASSSVVTGIVKTN